MRASSDALAVVGVFALALVARTLPYLEPVLGPLPPRPWGDGDVYHHLRRIEAITHAWPRVPDFDAWMAYPEGAYGIWSPLFDFVPATVAHITGAPSALVAFWWPPLLGALSCVVLHGLVGMLLGRAAAFAASLAFAILPGPVLIGAFGRVDHHVAEVLWQLLVLAQLARSGLQIERGQPPMLRQALVLGLFVGASLLTWLGSLLFLVVIPGVAAIAALVDPRTVRAAQLSAFVARAYVVGAAVCLPYALLNVARGRPAFASEFLSLFQPSLCLVLAVLPWAASWVGASRDREGRALLGRAAALVGAGLALFVLPGIGDALRASLRFLTRTREPWLAEVSEYAPFLSTQAAFEFGVATVGFLPFLVPIVWMLELLRARRVGLDFGRLLLFGWSAHAVALGLLQIRYLAYTAPIVALLPSWLHRSLDGRRRARWWGAALAAALLAWPTWEYWAPLAVGERIAYPQLRAEVDRFLRQIEQVTPDAGDPADLDTQPGYCVFAPWDLGHPLVALASRPVVANGFGTHLAGGGLADSVALYDEARSEAQALAILDRRRCRYLVTQAPLASELGRAPGFARRLHDHDGADSKAGLGAGALELVLDSAGLRVHEQLGYKLFERVAGAELRAPLLPVGSLEVETMVSSATRTIVYRRRLEPTGAQERTTRVAYPGSYRVLLEGAPAGVLAVSPEAVRDGGTLRLVAR